MERDLLELSVAQVVKPNIATIHISKKDHYWQQTQKYCKGFKLLSAKWGLLLTPNLSLNTLLWHSTVLINLICFVAQLGGSSSLQSAKTISPLILEDS